MESTTGKRRGDSVMQAVIDLFSLLLISTSAQAYEPGPDPQLCTTCMMQEHKGFGSYGYKVYPWVNEDGFGIIEPGKIFVFSGLSTYVNLDEYVCEPFLVEFVGDSSLFEEQFRELETELEQHQVLIVFEEDWSIAPMSIKELEETLEINCRLEDLENY